MALTKEPALGIGFIGSGFNARFRLQAFRAVREADVRGIWSPNRTRAANAAAYARELEVGEANTYDSITAMVADPAIDALWLTGPNHSRVENVEEIVEAVESGKGRLKGIACEKPLARNVAEAKRVIDLIERIGMPSLPLQTHRCPSRRPASTRTSTMGASVFTLLVPFWAIKDETYFTYSDGIARVELRARDNGL